MKLELELQDRFYEKEVRDGYTISSDMKKVWAVELDLLKKFSDVCKAHDLKWYADSGTLLGAVRHKGFIPWDDDIDVVMLREDYNKLIHLYGNEFSYPYFLQSAYSEKDYFRPHAQLRNSNTTGILRSEIGKCSFNQGIFIDIFPLDYVPESKFIFAVKHVALKMFDRFIFKVMPECNFDTSRPIKSTVKKFSHFVLSFCNPHMVYKKYESIAANQKTSTLSIITCYSVWKKTINEYKLFNASYYDIPLQKQFEDISIQVPSDCISVLREIYGDNFMIPVKEPTIHGEILFDTDKAYFDYL